MFDLGLARNLAVFFRQKSVLDLGCGLGDYGRVFKEEVRFQCAYWKASHLHAKRLPNKAASTKCGLCCGKLEEGRTH